MATPSNPRPQQTRQHEQARQKRLPPGRPQQQQLESPGTHAYQRESPRSGQLRRLARSGAALVLLSAAASWPGPGCANDAPGGELRLVHEDRSPASTGPLSEANRLLPGIAPQLTSRSSAEMEWRQRADTRLGELPLSLSLNALARAQSDGGDAPGKSGGERGGLHVNELQLSADLGAWQASAGKKVVGWDVGFGFRPNDVVQQERRRSLLPATLEGRPLLMLEGYDADNALALVWAHPLQRRDDSAEPARGAKEEALAMRLYRRQGNLDLHGFARQGEHTSTSLGAALAWVAGDALEVHGSVRRLRRHDSWVIDANAAGGSAGQVLAANPWRQATLGPASQALIGLQWTGESQQSVLVEAWRDGTALSAADWRAWGARNAALAASPAPAAARAGNLAWQSSPLDSANLHRDNLLIRLAWQPAGWQLSLDTVYTPADHGRHDTAAVQWQGDRWRLNAAWRQAAGPSDALARQLPARRTLALSAASAF